MIKIERELKENTICKPNVFYSNSQASFNSNGCLVIRNYNSDSAEHDNIIVLSVRETKAIIQLFELMRNNNILPF